MFKTTIITSRNALFEGAAWSVFLPGATGEFEVLEFHRPIVSLLKTGRIIIDWNKKILIRRGAVMVSHGELVALVEE